MGGKARMARSSVFERSFSPPAEVRQVVGRQVGLKARGGCMSRQPTPVEDGTHDMNAKAPAIVVDSAATT